MMNLLNFSSKLSEDYVVLDFVHQNSVHQKHFFINENGIFDVFYHIHLLLFITVVLYYNSSNVFIIIFMMFLPNIAFCAVFGLSQATYCNLFKAFKSNVLHFCHQCVTCDTRCTCTRTCICQNTWYSFILAIGLLVAFLISLCF